MIFGATVMTLAFSENRSTSINITSQPPKKPFMIATIDYASRFSSIHVGCTLAKVMWYNTRPAHRKATFKRAMSSIRLDQNFPLTSAKYHV